MGNQCNGSPEPEPEQLEPKQIKSDLSGAEKTREHLVYKRAEFVSPSEEDEVDDIDAFFGLEPVQAGPRSVPAATETRSPVPAAVNSAETATPQRATAEAAGAQLGAQQAAEPAAAPDKQANIAAEVAQEQQAAEPGATPDDQATIATEVEQEQQAAEPAVAPHDQANTATEAKQECVEGDQTRRLSEKSLHTLSRLRHFESDFDEVSAELVRIGAELGDPGVTRATASRAFDELAQLEARLDKLQFEGVDSVETLDLQSGKEESRALRKKLTGRAESMHSELEVLLRRAGELRRASGSVQEVILFDCGNAFPNLSGEYEKEVGDGLNGRALWRKQGGEAVLYCNPGGKYCVARSKESALKNLSSIRASEPSSSEQPWQVKAWLTMSKAQSKFSVDPSIKVQQVTAS